MATRIAINGFGRIGRAVLRAIQQRPELGLEVVAINDLGDVKNFAYLLQYDTVYGRAPFSVSAEEHALIVDGKKIEVTAEADPAKLPWKDMQIDIVIESTGFFTDYGKADAHRQAGAKKVVISAPVKGEAPEGLAGATVLIGINEDALKTCDITSNASCTTNAASPLIQILNEALGVEKALLSTTHAYTATQSIVDGPVKHGKHDYRDGRAAAANIIPSATGAAIAVTQAVPELAGKFDGISLRVPVPAGSMVDVTFVARRDTTAEEVNKILSDAAKEERWKRVFAVTEEELVSSDVLGLPYASIADLALTRVVGGNLVKVMAWYDNEAGYTHSLVEHVAALAKSL